LVFTKVRQKKERPKGREQILHFLPRQAAKTGNRRKERKGRRQKRRNRHRAAP